MTKMRWSTKNTGCNCVWSVHSVIELCEFTAVEKSETKWTLICSVASHTLSRRRWWSVSVFFKHSYGYIVYEIAVYTALNTSPVVWGQSIVISVSVCLFIICLSACTPRQPLFQMPWNFLYMLHVTVTTVQFVMYRTYGFVAKIK